MRRCELWQDHVKAGCFPDCDMLPLGRVGKGFGEERSTNFTRAEQVTMMTLWCIFRSPLMLGAEMTKLDDWTLSLLTNKEVLALLEDGHHGVQVQRTDEYAVWAGWNEKDGSVYAALFNLKEEEADVSVSLEEIAAALPVEIGEKLLEQTESRAKQGEIPLRELWTKKTEYCAGGAVYSPVEGHGAKLFAL